MTAALCAPVLFISMLAIARCWWLDLRDTWDELVSYPQSSVSPMLRIAGRSDVLGSPAQTSGRLSLGEYDSPDGNARRSL
jgi:hypothetical protein